MCFLVGLVWRPEEGEAPERDVAVQMPHYLQLYVSCYLVHFTVVRFLLYLSPFLGARTCPKGLNPALAIQKIKLELAAE